MCCCYSRTGALSVEWGRPVAFVSVPVARCSDRLHFAISARKQTGSFPPEPAIHFSERAERQARQAMVARAILTPPRTVSKSIDARLVGVWPVRPQSARGRTAYPCCSMEDVAMRTPYDPTTDALKPTSDHLSGTDDRAFSHPEQVVTADGLTRSQKRTLLASWASDRRAVENAPSLRQLDSGAVVSIDDILEAMTALDAHEVSAERKTSRRFVPQRTSRVALRLLNRRASPTDRDDDPPPSAAAAARPFSPIFTDALARSA